MNAAATRRRSSGWSSARRAKQLAYFLERIRARETADPVHAHKVLYRLADHAMVGIPYAKLSELHELQRRSHVLRAWCALRIARHDAGGWRAKAREALRSAAEHRRLASSWRKEGR